KLSFLRVAATTMRTARLVLRGPGTVRGWPPLLAPAIPDRSTVRLAPRRDSLCPEFARYLCRSVSSKRPAILWPTTIGRATARAGNHQDRLRRADRRAVACKRPLL